VQKIRICSSAKDEFILRISLLLIILLSTLLSALASYMLHKSTDYLWLYHSTQTFCCLATEPVVHRSLVFALASDNSKKLKLEEILALQTTNEMANQHRRGETPLHHSLSASAFGCTEILLQWGAVLRPGGKNGSKPDLDKVLPSQSEYVLILLDLASKQKELFDRIARQVNQTSFASIHLSNS